MRVVLDTNVLVSALINPHGPPGTIVANALAGRVTPVFDERILAEYRAVLGRNRFGFDAVAVTALLVALEGEGESVVAVPAKIESPDPDDLPFLEVAETALAAALVTGNTRHFRPVRARHGVPVYTPAAFVRKIRAATGD